MISRTRLLRRVAAAAAALLLAPCSLLPAAEAKQPNILFIFSDDHAYLFVASAFRAEALSFTS